MVLLAWLTLPYRASLSLLPSLSLVRPPPPPCRSTRLELSQRDFPRPLVILLVSRPIRLAFLTKRQNINERHTHTFFGLYNTRNIKRYTYYYIRPPPPCPTVLHPCPLLVSRTVFTQLPCLNVGFTTLHCSNSSEQKSPGNLSVSWSRSLRFIS